jgi:hypothetical protein
LAPDDQAGTSSISTNARALSRDVITEDGFLPNEKFIEYARPLVDGGLPKYVVLGKSAGGKEARSKRVTQVCEALDRAVVDVGQVAPMVGSSRWDDRTAQRAIPTLPRSARQPTGPVTFKSGWLTNGELPLSDG